MKRVTTHFSTYVWTLIAVSSVILGARVHSVRRGYLRIQSDSLSANAKQQLLGTSVLDWKLRTTTGDAVHRSSSALPWVVMLLGEPSCAPCRERQKSLVRLIGLDSALHDSTEVWFVSATLRYSRPSPARAGPVVRYVSVIDLGDLGPRIEKIQVPLVLLINRVGAIRAVSVGFHDDMDLGWLAEARNPH